jgi:hypothetical protein
MENLFRRLLQNLVLPQVKLFRLRQGLLDREPQVNQQVLLLGVGLVLQEAAQHDLVLLLVVQEDAQMTAVVQVDGPEVAAEVHSSVEDVSRRGVDGRSKSCSRNKLLLTPRLMLRCLKGKC